MDEVSHVRIVMTVTDLATGEEEVMTVPKAQRPEVSEGLPPVSPLARRAGWSNRLTSRPAPILVVRIQPISDPKTGISHTFEKREAGRG